MSGPVCYERPLKSPKSSSERIVEYHLNSAYNHQKVAIAGPKPRIKEEGDGVFLIIFLFEK